MNPIEFGKKALELACHYQNRCCDQAEIIEMFCMDAAAALCQAGQKSPGWISTSERLPEKWQEVMAWPYPTDYCMTAQLGNSGWEYGEYTRDGHNEVKMQAPKFWMPMPLPPVA